jgi:hypothetical protein
VRSCVSRQCARAQEIVSGSAQPASVLVANKIAGYHGLKKVPRYESGRGRLFESNVHALGVDRVEVGVPARNTLIIATDL